MILKHYRKQNGIYINRIMMALEKMQPKQVKRLYTVAIYFNDALKLNNYFAGGLDLILMPGVAFSTDGKRLGHGMGYYDKFLENFFIKNPSRCSSSSASNICRKISEGKTILFGLAFKEQIFDEIPITDKDVILDEIITA